MSDIFSKYRFTASQIKILEDIKSDFIMWNTKRIEDIFPHSLKDKFKDKQLTKEIVKYIQNYHNQLKNQPNDYSEFKNIKYNNSKKFSFHEINKDGLGLGSCPVASNNTRCCNLLTLDAIESCGFDCSYCSIQSFYNENRIGIDSGFKDKLKNLKLDPNKIYHIGTGQS